MRPRAHRRQVEIPPSTDSEASDHEEAEPGKGHQEVTLAGITVAHHHDDTTTNDEEEEESVEPFNCLCIKVTGESQKSVVIIRALIGVLVLLVMFSGKTAKDTVTDWATEDMHTGAKAAIEVVVFLVFFIIFVVVVWKAPAWALPNNASGMVKTGENKRLLSGSHERRLAIYPAAQSPVHTTSSHVDVKQAHQLMEKLRQKLDELDRLKEARQK